MTPERRIELVDRLTLIGWLLAGGPIGLIAFQLQRVREVGSQPFASVWDQRIEVTSFLVLPPNIVVLAPATFVVAFAVWLAGKNRGPWLSGLLTLVVTIAISLAVVGAIAVITLFVGNRTGGGDLGGVYLRVGGILCATGLATICRTADQESS